MPTTIDLHAGSPRTSWFTELSPWAPWAARLTLRPPWPGDRLDCYGGVYLLAHFQAGSRQGPADYLDPEIVYVGESGHFRRRWNDFARTVRGGTGHAGGRSYRGRFGALGADLHVAALGVWISNNQTSSTPDEPWTTAYRLHVERHVIWTITHTRNGQGLQLLNRR